MALEIGPEDPRSGDVVALLARHLTFAHEHSPPGDVHALDVERLTAPGITFVGAREDGVLLGVGAVQRLDATHAELKSMHTAVEARGRGVARAILSHLVALATAQGYRQVSLETGSMAAFAPARALYAAAGFTECPPFGDYDPSRHSTFMTLHLPGAGPA
ncbi:N-acetyltransferase [Nocardioides guangzhouensis]|uniref:N-acetyltransferase n=1 Tax=Nocardioides guangzhouensis TaxID=2497878 RepID=A0A4Q4Z7U2_9ACTN|nr:GNAT family N-acetyltransferase [Nocardioides guangzhouensis]RYP83588.1 N-acetyltransferase [Nocardioides guangzhouensis]